MDSKFSHLAWVNQELGELNYPLLADFTKQVSREYGVLLERLGAALRGTFIIDPDGLIRAYSVQDLTVGRSIDEMLRLVSALKTGEDEVQDDEIVGFREGLAEPEFPVGHDGHRISLVPEMEFHQASDIPVVFDHQNIAGHPGDSRQPAAIFRTAATISAGSIRTV